MRKLKKENVNRIYLKNELFRKLVKQAVDNTIKFSYVLADSWFSSKETIKFIHHDMNKYFVLAIKSNRTVATSLPDKKREILKAFKIRKLILESNN